MPCFSYPDWVTRKLLAQGDPWNAANTTVGLTPWRASCGTHRVTASATGHGRHAKTLGQLLRPTTCPAISAVNPDSHMIFVTMLFACTSASGTWVGECGPDTETVKLEMELEDEGGNVSGDFEISSGGQTYDGDVDGEREDEDLEFDVEISSGGSSETWTFKGEIDGDDLEGSLDLDYIVVDCELERD